MPVGAAGRHAMRPIRGTIDGTLERVYCAAQPFTAQAELTDATMHPRHLRLRRSLLFVPGADARKFEKARQAGADTILFDLEDAVPPEHKARAREQVAQAIGGGGFGDAELAVRINAPSTPYFEADLTASLAAGAAAILLPKAEEVDVVRDVVGRVRARDPAPALLLLVESARGVTRAAELAAVDGVAALCFGHADFALDMGLPEADPAAGAVLHARCAIAIAAKAAGVTPIDNICLAVKDTRAFEEDTACGVRLGYEGKLCIHPEQVPIANALYTPTPDQVAYARRLLAGWEQAQAEGRGVFTLDGKMIDAPLVALQRRVLASAERAARGPAKQA
jgi:citrate lyase subunit beta/citryl-CoA lyase